MNGSEVTVGCESRTTVRPIGIVAYDGFELLDLTGPMDAFGLTNLGLQRSGIAHEPVYAIKVIAKRPGLVRSSCGLRIQADHSYDDITGGLDTLVIPGAPDVASVLADPGLSNWIRTMVPHVRRLVSVCTGAFLLADAGVLDGLRATTHWAFCERFATDYPSVTVEADRIFLRDGSIYSSGGITSGIDLSLALVDEDWGREQALLLARYMVVFLKRPGGQTQFSGFLVSDATKDPDLRALQVWIMENPAEDLRVEALAARVAMSPRNFARVFQTETGMTPAKFVEKARVDAARQFLGSSDERIELVAVICGFGDSERMRRAVIRNLGINPQDCRTRFGPPALAPTPAVTPHHAAAMRMSLNTF